MKLSAEVSERIRAIGFLCALLVVPIHCPTLTEGAAAAPWLVGLQTLGGDTIARLAVPWFFVISGFFLCRGLLAANSLAAGWGAAVRKRLRTLLVPYLLWNLIYYVFKLGTGKYGFEVGHGLDQLVGYNPYEVPACGQLWYVRCLMAYVVAAPVFWWLTKRCPWALAGTLYAAWLVGVPQPWRYMQYTDWSYLAYFATGFALARVVQGCGRGDSIMQAIAAGGGTPALPAGAAVGFGVCAAAVVWSAIAGKGLVELWAGKLMILAGLPALWWAGGWIVKGLRPLRGCWGMGFFVYAAHVIFVSLARKALAVGLHGAAYDSVGYVGIVLAGAGCPLLLAVAMRRWCPSALGWLCGGRG